MMSGNALITWRSDFLCGHTAHVEHSIEGDFIHERPSRR
jgi:hypothetical protein